MNKARLLLQRIGQRAVERVQWAALTLFLAGGLVIVLPVTLGWLGALAWLLLLAAGTLRIMAMLSRVVVTAVLETASVYTLVGRIVEFQVVPDWHIIGTE